jgi:hypothetical protein
MHDPSATSSLSALALFLLLPFSISLLADISLLQGRQLTRSSLAAWSFFRNDLSLSSFSIAKSGNFSTLVLLRRLTIGFSLCATRILFTCITHSVTRLLVEVSDTDLFVVLERHLTYGHTSIFLEI